MKQIFYLLLISCIVSCTKDDDNRFMVYSGVDPSEKQPLVTENFIDNRNGWHYIDTAFYFNPDSTQVCVSQILTPGELTMTANSGGDIYFQYDSLAYIANFELESEFKFIRIKPNETRDTTAVCYMDWGFVDMNSHVNFIKFASNGLIDFGDSYGPTRWGKPVDGVRINEYNKYTIRKVGNMMYFFVNEVYIGNWKLLKIPGNNIGFRIFTGDVFTIRNFKFLKF